jgi:Fur family transcriptional regulator, ferric uptake regulator
VRDLQLRVTPFDDVTAPHTGPALHAPDLDSAIEALRTKGLRVSAARRLVLGALYGAPGPVTADQIADGLAGRLPRSDPASVYRNLETLEEVGLVRHFHLGHGPGLYAPAGLGEREYLVCNSCGAVKVVEPDEMEPVRSVIEQRFGFEASFSHFPVLGLCADCARERPDDDAERRRLA